VSAHPAAYPGAGPDESEPVSLHEQITADLTAAMKARDKARTSALRMVVSALRNQAIAEGKGPQGTLDDAAVQKALATEVKRRRESAAAYRDAGREEQAAAEEAEVAVYEAYLPEQLSDDELSALVDGAIAEVGAQDASHTGQVMKTVMPKVAGRAEGARVSALVKERLSG
jgi:uncharacterized protein